MKRGRRISGASGRGSSSCAARFSSRRTALTVVLRTAAFASNLKLSRRLNASSFGAAANSASRRSTVSSVRLGSPPAAPPTCANVRHDEAPSRTASSRMVRPAPACISAGAIISRPVFISEISALFHFSGGLSPATLPTSISRSRARVIAT